MLTFTVDARNGSFKDACNACCCEHVDARPGEKNKVLVNYGPWAAPIGGHGLAPNPGIEIECLTCSSERPPVVAAGFGRTTTGVVYNGNLAPLYTGDEETTVFAVEPLYPPSHGDVVVNADGTFVYTPNTLFAGIDRFWWNVNGIVAEFVIAVDISAQQQYPQPPFTAPVSVPASRIAYDNRLYYMSFVLAVSPGALTGEVYRLTIRQKALDCDGESYEHLSCYDIKIGKC